MKFSSSQRQPYDRLASEYYDPLLHPTSNNLGEASGQFILRTLARLALADKKVLEVGAGRSQVIECLQLLDCAVADLVISDLSLRMLQHSLTLMRRMVVADAQVLPFEPESFDLVVSSLGDPYNVQSFWDEAARVVRRKGHLLYTTPSKAWADQYRAEVGDPRDKAIFFMSDGEKVEAVSRIDEPARLISRAEESGFHCVRHEQVFRGDLGSRISSKLYVVQGSKVLPILDGYLFVNDLPKPR